MLTRLASGKLLGIVSLIAWPSIGLPNSVIPGGSRESPVGVILKGEYARLDGRSLFGPSQADESPSQRLARRFVQLTSEKDKDRLLELYFQNDGSRARMSGIIDRSETLRPQFRLQSAQMIEQLQWDGLTVLTILLKGVPALKPEVQRLFAICPQDPTCYLVFPQSGSASRYLESLDTVVNVFSKYSTSASSEQQTAFSARRPLVVALRLNVRYGAPTLKPVEVSLVVDRYQNVAAMNSSTQRVARYPAHPELAPIAALIGELNRMDGTQIASTNTEFRRFMNSTFSADFAADLNYRLNRLENDEYVSDSLAAADFVKAVRGWESVAPACSVRLGYPLDSGDHHM
jgi:hypothetical protein